MNLASQVTLRDLETALMGAGTESCNSRLALFTAEGQRALQQGMVYVKTLLKTQVCVN
jgi:hypothetical protein